MVAYDQNRIMGDSQRPGLLWSIKEDLQLFRKFTFYHPVIMGRKTWEALPPKNQPLCGRTNIILTSKDFPAKPPYIFPAYSALRALLLAHDAPGSDDIFIIGGLQVYKEFLKLGLVDNIFASEIGAKYVGDLRFPPINKYGTWERKILKRCEAFNFVRYQNRDKKNNYLEEMD